MLVWRYYNLKKKHNKNQNKTEKMAIGIHKKNPLLFSNFIWFFIIGGLGLKLEEKNNVICIVFDRPYFRPHKNIVPHSFSRLDVYLTQTKS